MKLPSCTRQALLTEIISYLYILLFVYAGASKLLDFENFGVQLGQSPVTSHYAKAIAVFIPFYEIAIALLLLIPSMRLYGLYLGSFLMVTFSAYIFIILTYSSYIPCSCGGILEQMGWWEHFVFNIVFVVLGFSAVVMLESKPAVRLYLGLLCGTLLSIAVVTIMHVYSHRSQRYHNRFVRHFPHHLIKSQQVDLQASSYYFAGHSNGVIYLGNYNAPLRPVSVTANLQEKKDYLIQAKREELPSAAAQLRVAKDNFYLIDGTLPTVLGGKVGEWQARLEWQGNVPFSHYELMSFTKLCFKSQDALDGSSILGTLTFGGKEKTLFRRGLLQKQIDGVFDVDGTLRFDPQHQRMVYTYLYRNQFIVADPELTLSYRGRTIDTTKTANLTIHHLKGRNEQKLSKPPLVVNPSSAIGGHFLFVHSNLPGNFEPLDMWSVASIIDVYDLRDGSYVSSLYIYNENRDKLKHFFIAEGSLYCFIGKLLVRYKLPIALL